MHESSFACHMINVGVYGRTLLELRILALFNEHAYLRVCLRERGERRIAIIMKITIQYNNIIIKKLGHLKLLHSHVK